MTGLLSDLRRLNGLGDRAIAEPFAGGAGASLSLLYLEEAHNIYINDADRAIYDFWWALMNRPKAFLDLVSNTQVNISEWKNQRDIYRARGRLPRVRRGFATFYLNRCNRSGIIMNGGPIGGIGQVGKWKLNARYNREDLIRRCEKVIEYRDRISVSCADGIKFVESLDPKATFFFVDPPYFEKGPTLYLNALSVAYHEALAAQLKSMSDAAWVLTYDDCTEIRRLYSGWATIRPFSLRYAAAERRSGTELLITPVWMQLPTKQASAAIKW